MTMQAINEMVEQGMTKKDIAKEFGVSRTYFYEFIKKNGEKKKRGRPPMTEEQKAAAKEKRQEALAKNPDMYKKEYRMDKAESLHGGAMQSLERYCTATDEEVSEMMGNVIKWYEIGKLDKPQNDDEVEHRIELYFQYVFKTGEKPSLEKLALALGVTVRTTNYWRDGQFCSARRQELIRNAITALAAMDAELVNNNKIPQVTYIFRAKNFFEMKDQQEMTINHNTKRVADEEELRKRIMDGVIIDGDYEDVEGD